MLKRESNYRKWRDMSGVQKLAWFGKLAVSLATFGFAFPRVMDPFIADDSAAADS